MFLYIQYRCWKICSDHIKNNCLQSMVLKDFKKHCIYFFGWSTNLPLLCFEWKYFCWRNTRCEICWQACEVSKKTEDSFSAILLLFRFLEDQRFNPLALTSNKRSQTYNKKNTFYDFIFLKHILHKNKTQASNKLRLNHKTAHTNWRPVGQVQSVKASNLDYHLRVMNNGQISVTEKVQVKCRSEWWGAA